MEDRQMKSTLTAYKTGRGTARHTAYHVYRVCKTGRVRIYRYDNSNLPQTLKEIMMHNAWTSNDGNRMTWEF